MKYLKTRPEYIHNDVLDREELTGFWLVCELHGDLEYFDVEEQFLPRLLERTRSHEIVMHF